MRKIVGYLGFKTFVIEVSELHFDSKTPLGQLKLVAFSKMNAIIKLNKRFKGLDVKQFNIIPEIKGLS